MENDLIRIMQDMEKTFIACAEDVEKFVEGNNSAGTRVRKYMQQIKNLKLLTNISRKDQR